MIPGIVLLAVLGVGAEAPPCVRVLRANMHVEGEVKVCPGRYRVRDPEERGVLVITGSGTTLDLTGVTIESGDTLPEGFMGAGVVVRGVDSVTISGGKVTGYRYGIRIEGGRGHRINGIDLGGSRRAGRGRFGRLLEPRAA